MLEPCVALGYAVDIVRRRRKTLIAPRGDSPEGPVDKFDIHMRGLRETVFLDI